MEVRLKYWPDKEARAVSSGRADVLTDSAGGRRLMEFKNGANDTLSLADAEG